MVDMNLVTITVPLVASLVVFSVLISRLIKTHDHDHNDHHDHDDDHHDDDDHPTMMTSAGMRLPFLELGAERGKQGEVEPSRI